MRRTAAPLLAVTVALVLADSAVVTLALPDILLALDATVTEVAWVLISFNLVLGLVAVPAAVWFGRARPRAFTAVGIAVFAGAWVAKRIPEKVIRYVSSGLFLVIGVLLAIEAVTALAD